jgi:hypothetical protein
MSGQKKRARDLKIGQVIRVDGQKLQVSGDPKRSTQWGYDVPVNHGGEHSILWFDYADEIEVVQS